MNTEFESTEFEILPFSAESVQGEHAYVAEGWFGEGEEAERAGRAPRGGGARVRAAGGVGRGPERGGSGGRDMSGGCKAGGAVGRRLARPGGKPAGLAGKTVARGGKRGKPGAMGQAGVAAVATGKRGQAIPGDKRGGGAATGGGRWQSGPGVGRPRRWPYPYGWTGPVGGFWPSGAVMVEPDWLALAHVPMADGAADGGDGPDGGFDVGGGNDGDGDGDGDSGDGGVGNGGEDANEW